MSETNIEWTQKVWNPIRGCSRVSEGCRNCYAERQAIRQTNPGQAYEGLVRSIATVRDGKQFNEPRWTGKVVCDAEKLDDPLRWRKPARIFVNSMSDLFHEDVPDAFIHEIFLRMMMAPQHTYQILTKRPERMARFNFNNYMPMAGWNNVWLGVSVEDQRAADFRIPLLLKTPAAVRWISAEPLLGPIDLENHRWLLASRGGVRGALNWAVVGGESGPGARPCNLEWIRSIVQQCQASAVPVFVKQLGAEPFLHRQSSFEKKIPGGMMRCQSLEVETSIVISDRKGGNLADFPIDLQVREYPGVQA